MALFGHKKPETETEVIENSHASSRVQWLYSRHFAMERFSVITVLFILLFIVVIIWCMNSIRVGNIEHFDTTAIYEESVTGTQSGAAATPVALAVNQERTVAAFLFQFSDASAVPSRASDYRVHLTGTNASGGKRDLFYPMRGSFYLYGSTGYAALYLTCPSGFDGDLYHVAIEATKLVKGTARDDDGNEVAVSDVWGWTINPGITGRDIHAKSLDGDAFDAEAFYREVVASSGEDTAKKVLDTDLKAMSESLAEIGEYLGRLSDADIKVAGVLPTSMATDSVESDAQGNLGLVTEHHVKGALQIPWRATSLNDGGYWKYVKDTNGLTLSQYVAAIKDTSESIEKWQPVWTFTNGESLADVSEENASSAYTQINENARLAESAVSTYLSLKNSYEVAHQQELLVLELESDAMASSITVNDDILDLY